jgi:hypothetical protein
MRHCISLLLLGCCALAQDTGRAASESPHTKGAFYVNGIVHQYEVGKEYIVVAAAHSVINHKFMAVKVRVYNAGRSSVTVKPEDIVVEDAADGRELGALSGAELARRMRKPYNMARMGVNAFAGGEPGTAVTSDMTGPKLMEMMRAMAQQGNPAPPSGSNVLYTDTPGVLDVDDEPPRPMPCDQACRFRNQEAQGTEPLAKLQTQTAPDAVEKWAFLANTIPPRANVVGVLYYPLNKLSETGGPSKGKKSRMARVRVPVGNDSFEFVLPVE